MACIRVPAAWRKEQYGLQRPAIFSENQNNLSPFSHTSEVIAELAAEPDGRLSIRDIMSALGDRAFALLVVVLGLPNCLPMPPPIPLICGLLLAFVALQLAVGRKTPWFPKVLLERSVNRKDVARVTDRAVPLFEKLERYSRPRVMLFVEPVAYRIIGVLLLLLALALVFAPPIIGQIPLGFAVCLVGLGLVERDGLVVVAGLALGGFGASLSFSFIYALVAGVGVIL